MIAGRLRGLLLALALVAAAAGAQQLRLRGDERALARSSRTELAQRARGRPDDPRVFHYLGLRALQAGDPAAASDAYWRAVQLSPDSEPDWLGWAAAAGSAKGADAADAILAEYLRGHGSSRAALLARARLHRVLEDDARVREYARAAATIDPSAADAWLLAGEASLALKSPQEAEEALRRAVSLRPDSAAAYGALGQALLAQRRYPDALAALETARRLAPDDPAAHLALGRAQVDAGRLDAARASLAVALDRGDPLSDEQRYDAFLAFGQSYARAADWPAARPWLERAAALAPGSAAAQFALIRVYRGLGETALAERASRRHRQIDAYNSRIRDLAGHIAATPDDPAPRLELARLYASHGAVVDAGKTYRSLIVRNLAVDTARRELAALTGKGGVR